MLHTPEVLLHGQCNEFRPLPLQRLLYFLK